MAQNAWQAFVYANGLNLLEISQFICILKEPFPCVGPYIFIKILFSHVIKALSVVFIRVHDVAP